MYQRKQHELPSGLMVWNPLQIISSLLAEAEQDHDGKLLALTDRCREKHLDVPNPRDAKAVQRLIALLIIPDELMSNLSDECEHLRLRDKDAGWH
ncbi:hypothetical protein SKAU_G00253800 [Synaphobranchus kaupii]|uniref:Uncharacterized protein n=1 Tax=Synaphobranchus kaupii TaxID=118154 RepID=A0A9Q1F3D5_SYNKA|nr:hypothetical protein SKAU_G00253800 [Synaphobranchus kaupii]